MPPLTVKCISLCLLPLNIGFLLLVNSRFSHLIPNYNPTLEVPSQEEEQQQLELDQTKTARRLSLNQSAIRSWGCNRNETPFVFVHVGKAGGGSVRMRIAAASHNFSLPKDSKTRDLPASKALGSYYPLVQQDGTIEKVRMINSMFLDRRPSNEKTYEGNVACHAGTPVGIAIGCPTQFQRIQKQTQINYGVCDWNSTDCHLVYLGHNNLGSELNWLPYKYMSHWWNQIVPQTSTTPSIPWERLDPSNIWCDSLNISRPRTYHPGNFKAKHPAHLHDQCSIPLSRQVDSLASMALSPQDGLVPSWAPLYASLPVLRATVLRDPFDWLISKYFWHWRKGTNSTLTCDNLQDAIHAQDYRQATRKQLFDQQAKDVLHPGWLTKFAWIYMFYLCGDDCLIRFATGRAGLPDLERQAEENLRHSFAVVGLLEELDDFYDMLTARVQYIDTNLNAEQKGGRHGTTTRGEGMRCKKVYRDPVFQKKLLAASPEVRTMQRLYNVAVEVNRFQKQELKECSVSAVSTD